MSSGFFCFERASLALASTSCQRLACIAVCAAVKISPRAGLVVGAAFCALTVKVPAASTAATRTERTIDFVICDFSNWRALSRPFRVLYHNPAPAKVSGRAMSYFCRIAAESGLNVCGGRQPPAGSLRELGNVREAHAHHVGTLRSSHDVGHHVVERQARRTQVDFRLRF